MLPTFKPAKYIEITILARLCFIDPARIAERRCVLLMTQIQRHKRVEIIDLCGELCVWKIISISVLCRSWDRVNPLGKVCNVAAAFFCSSSRKSLGRKRSCTLR